MMNNPMMYHSGPAAAAAMLPPELQESYATISQLGIFQGIPPEMIAHLMSQRLVEMQSFVRDKFVADPFSVTTGPTPVFYVARGQVAAAVFDSEALVRLNRLFPSACWWPFGIHATWWGEALPTALLGGGRPHSQATGAEHAQLEAVWHTIRTAAPENTRVLLEGRTGPNESWNLSFLRRFFAPS